ncbi:hypothetical protein HZA99_00275 [Candidatus Woesearchaeota archaeon]|nr:hypothetical protein [Candidatus Woesearchaeota archaeon]
MADGASPIIIDERIIDDIVQSFGEMEDAWFGNANAESGIADAYIPEGRDDIPYQRKGILTQAKEAGDKVARRYDFLAEQWDSFAETQGREIAGHITRAVDWYHNH